MNNNPKTYENILKELEELKLENESLKTQYEQGGSKFTSSKKSQTLDDSPIHIITPYEKENIRKLSEANDNLQKTNEELSRKIAEHKQTVDELKRSEQKYCQLVDSATEAIVVVQDGMIRLSNLMTRSMTGYSEDEIATMPFQMFIHPKDRVLLVDNHQRRLRGEDVPSYYVFRLQNKNGNTVWVYINSVLIDWEGRPATLNFLTDITKLKEAEEALKQSSQKWEALISASPDGIGMITLNGKIQLISEKLLIMHGYYTEQTSEFYGRSIFDFIDSSSHKMLIENTRKLIAGEKDHRLTEYLAIKKDGSRFNIDVNACVLLDSNGNPESILYVERNITERKLAEEALRQTNQKLEAIISASPDGIGMVSLDGKMQFISDNLFKIYGYSIEERGKLIGRSAFDFIDPSNHEILVENLLKLKAGEKDNRITEYLAIKKDGSRFYIDVNAAILLDSNGNPASILFVERDITERKRTEEEIKLKNEQLIAINADKDKFFSIIAHDLKSPLHGFLGLTEIMASNTTDFSNEEINQSLIMLHNSSAQLFGLLENLLQWSSMQRGVFDYQPMVLNLNKLILGSIETIFLKAEQKEITIYYTPDDSLQVLADENMLKTILRNLLSNAVKFTYRGGNVKISIREQKDSLIEIAVCDNGMGISDEDVKKLFKINEKLSSKGTEGELSTGLGLLLCKEFVEKQGGQIKVESKEGNGSRFIFTLKKQE